MSCEKEEKQWICGKKGVVNFQRVGSIVRDISEPCLSQSPIKVVITMSKMLKPDKWQAAFDIDGKVSGFQKALKLISMGGVDPSIRSEVWEFLLGCYALGSTAEYRKQLRTARRVRYYDLLKQCQMMHSSVGTGSLAYVVGSKVMDMRKTYRHELGKEGQNKTGQVSMKNTVDLENNGDWSNNCADTPNQHQRESSSESVDFVSGRGSPDSAVYDSSFYITSCRYDRSLSERGGEGLGSYLGESFLDFPPLPVTDLFRRSHEDKVDYAIRDDEHSKARKSKSEDARLRSFQIEDNIDLTMEKGRRSASSNVTFSTKSEIERVHPDTHKPLMQSNCKTGADVSKVSDIPETPLINASMPRGGGDGEDRVSNWLWTLHRIVVDVVRTDGHLQFYEDSTNLGRMSDILAIYAWVDPATGYCQGMSDLVSPFVVLFEDNADAFWCFEMLIRRMRANFQMEGPTGVMKQLQSLWHILQLTDREMFSHLSHIGAESLHFAFRMLLVLFRRELSFNEALRMWEMMWAADFDESLASNLEQNCLELLVVEPPRSSVPEVRDESAEEGNSLKGEAQSRHGDLERSLSDDAGMKSASAYTFCGLTRNFWSKNDRMPVTNVVSSIRRGDDELPVFCVAAILIMNRHKIMKETDSIDDMIKIFNDKLLRIRVRRCIRTAIKLRKKYLYKLTRRKDQSQDQDNDQNQTESGNQIGSQNLTKTKTLAETQNQSPPYTSD